MRSSTLAVGRAAVAIAALAVAFAFAVALVVASGAGGVGGGATVIVSADLRTDLVPKLYALDQAGVRVQIGGVDGDWDSALSPDRKYLAFVSARDRYSAIYVANTDGGDVRRLTERLACVDRELRPRWSPDGSRIAFEYPVGTLCTPLPANGRPLGPAVRRYTVRQIHRLAVVDLAGDLRTYAVNGWYPQWSPDGTRLAYVEENATSVIGGIGRTTGVLDVETGSHRSLGPGRKPVWSATGNAIALPSGRGTVRVFDRYGRLMRAIRGRGAAWARCGLITSRRGAAVASPDRRDAAFRTATGVAVRQCGRGAQWRVRGGGEPVSFSPAGTRLLVRRCTRSACELRVAGARATVEIRSRAQQGAPLWAADGRALAFTAVAGAVVLADAATGKTLVRQSNEPRSQITLAGWRDRNTIIYGSRASVPMSAIYRVTLATGAANRIVSDAWLPALSRDGGTLAFARSPGIWVWDSARGEHLLARTPGYNTASGLAWSPDGRTIAYSTPGTIGLVTLDGTKRNTNSFAPARRVSDWSPDGQWIAYTAGDGVWLVHPDGTDNHRFVAQASALTWSLDGRRVAYISKGWALVVARSDGNDAHAVATGISPEAIAWSADGTHILATRSVSRWPLDALFTRLIAVAADGSDETAITDGTGLVLDITSQATNG